MRTLIHLFLSVDWRGTLDNVKAFFEFVSFVCTSATIAINALPRYEDMAEADMQCFYIKWIVRPLAFMAGSWRKHIPSMGWHFGAYKDPNLKPGIPAKETEK